MLLKPLNNLVTDSASPNLINLSHPIKYCASKGYNKSSDNPFVPVSGPQGLQEAHGLHLLVPGAGAVGARSYPIKYSASVGYNESSDTPFVSVSSPQGLQDAHGLHLLVPGAGVMGARTK